MTFKSVKKLDKHGNEHWYLHEFTTKDEGIWYDIDVRGQYAYPDIIIDAISNGYDSVYNLLIELSNEHPKVFSDEYSDVRDVMLLDEFIYDEFDNVTSWLNDDSLFIIPEGYYIGLSDDGSCFGMWLIDEWDEVNDDDDDDINDDEA